MGSNRLIYQGATPIIDAESFEDVLSGIYGCLRVEDVRPPEKRAWVGNGPAIPKNDLLLSALLANPMRIEQMISLMNNEAKSNDLDKSADMLTTIMVKLATYERDGLIARFPDGRYGPAQV